MASLTSSTRIEYLIWGSMGLGVGFSVLQKTFGGWGAKQGGRTAKVFIELQRKSFHMIGGCIICLIYHYGYAPSRKPLERDGSAPNRHKNIFQILCVWGVLRLRAPSW